MKRPIALVGAVALAAALSGTALASSWSDSGIQWATNKPFTLSVVDNTTGIWPALVVAAAADWSLSSAADVVIGGHGKIKVTVSNISSPTSPCGWMTVTLTSGHLKTAAITVNDACTGDHQIVICQELGHALGMPDHRLDLPPSPSCMAPALYGPHPIQDDFDELASLYP